MFEHPTASHLVFFVLQSVAITIVVAHRGGEMKLERERILDEDDESSLSAISKQLFQDIFTEHGTDDRLQFGYVCENPDQWEQRFEEKDLRNNRHRGKVKWGNVDGGYGEHYWDINYK